VILAIVLTLLFFITPLRQHIHNYTVYTVDKTIKHKHHPCKNLTVLLQLIFGVDSILS